jgi:flagellar hook-length control protein FliK
MTAQIKPITHQQQAGHAHGKVAAGKGKTSTGLDIFSQMIAQVVASADQAQCANTAQQAKTSVKQAAAALTPAQLDTLQTQLQNLLAQLPPEAQVQLQKLAQQNGLSTDKLGQLAADLAKLAEKSPELTEALKQAADLLQTTDDGTDDTASATQSAELNAGAVLLLLAARSVPTNAAQSSQQEPDATGTATATTTGDASEASVAQPRQWDVAELKQALAEALNSVPQWREALAQQTTLASSQTPLLAKYIPQPLLGTNLNPTVKSLKGTLVTTAPAGENVTTTVTDAPRERGVMMNLLNAEPQQDATADTGLKGLIQAFTPEREKSGTATDGTDQGLATPLQGAPVVQLSLGQVGDVNAMSAPRGSDQKVIDQVQQATEKLLGRVDGSVRQDGEKMTTALKLNPAELGQVNVALTMGDDHTIQAQFTAQRPETAALLERNVRTLSDSLTRQGYTVERLQVVTQPTLSTASSARSETGSQHDERQMAWKSFQQQGQNEQRQSRRNAFALAEDQA